MGNLHLVDLFEWTEDDYKVSETMLSYFANFIIKGDPNGDELAEWPAAEADDPAPPVMVLDTESKAVAAKDDDRYRLLDRFHGND